MPNILGMSLVQFGLRVTYAVISALVMLFVFYKIPQVVYQGVTGLPNLAGSFFYFAILISVLSGIQIVFKGRFLGDGAAIFNGVAQIFYLYFVTSGGVLSFRVADMGLTVTLDFRTIMYLMMIPSALLIVSAIVSAASRTSTTRVQNLDEITL